MKSSEFDALYERRRGECEQMRIDFPGLWEDVHEAFVACDPVGLITMGAPDDEYDGEQTTIQARLPEARSVKELRRIIHDEFILWFGSVAEDGHEIEFSEEIEPNLYGSSDGYDALAETLWRIWQAHIR